MEELSMIKENKKEASKKVSPKELYSVGENLSLIVQEGKDNKRVSFTKEGIICFYKEDKNYIPPRVESLVSFEVLEANDKCLIVKPIEILKEPEVLFHEKIMELKQLDGKFKFKN